MGVSSRPQEPAAPVCFLHKGSGQAAVTATTELGGAALAGAAGVTVAGASGVAVGALRAGQSAGRSQIHGVWGASADTVYAVGTAGTLLRRDASGWHALDGRTTAPLFGVGRLGPGCCRPTVRPITNPSSPKSRTREGFGSLMPPATWSPSCERFLN